MVSETGDLSESEKDIRLQQYERLLSISRDLASTYDLDVLLKGIATAAKELTTAEAASILLYDEQHGDLYFSAATNIERPMMNRLIVPKEGSIAGWIIKHREPVLLNDVSNDPRHYQEIGKKAKTITRSLLGVPLIAQDRMTGVLEVINKQTGPFTPEDQNLILILGMQAAVAINNVRLFKQSDLISELVHEIRTPITAISTIIQLLKQPGGDSIVHETYINIIDYETRRLSTLTKDVLEFARLESGRTQFELKSFTIGDLLQETVKLMMPEASARDIVIITAIPPNLPKIVADRGKIKQVILNLLSNAVKYNRPSGTITVEAERGQTALIIRISDTGIGISKENLEHIFDKFYRSGTYEENAIGGAGLGLSISKRIIEAHHGRISVRSKLGKGTVFEVFLPLHNSA